MAGLIFYGTQEDGSVLTASLKSELTAAAASLGIGEEQILIRYNDRDADWTEIEDSILECIDAGCQIIFGGSREYDSVIAAIAEEYPEVMFACVGSSLGNGENSGGFDIDPAGAMYLCGVLAGAQTRTGRVGFLAAKDTADEQVTRAVNAFAWGVFCASPDAVVEVGVTGKWFLPEAETAAVSQMRDLGCDVIGAYTDSTAGLRAAAEEGLSVVACGSADAYLYGTEPLCTALSSWRLYFTEKLNQVLAYEVTGEFWSGDCYNGAAVLEASQDADTQLLSQAEEELARLNPDAPETEAPETEAPSGESAAEESGEETEEAEEEASPTIGIDADSGYLENVRVFAIQIPEEAED